MLENFRVNVLKVRSCLVSYHCNFVRLQYIQLYTCRNMSPRYSHNLHSRHSYECWWSIPPDLQNLNLIKRNERVIKCMKNVYSTGL